MSAATAEPGGGRRCVLRLLRFNEWWDKLLHVAGASLLLWLTTKKTTADIHVLGLYLAAVFSLLTVGYAVNAAADFPQDRVAAACKRKAPPSRAHSWLTAVAAAALAIFFILMATRRREPLWIALATLVVGCGYSLPPLRFKERGAWGVLVGAVTQKPALFMILVAMLGAWNWISLVLASWLFCGGVLGMLGHQVLDRPADIMAGVRTYATAHGSRWSIRLCLLFAAGVAGACLAPLAIAMTRENLLISAGLGLLSSVYLFKGLRAKRGLSARAPY